VGPLIWHQTIAALRSGAFWIANAVHIALLALFVVIWGDGLPVADGGTNWTQFAALQETALAVILPWIAVRSGGISRPVLTRVALVTAVRPSHVLAARILALVAVLIVVVLLPLPLAFVMQQAAAAPAGVVGASVVRLVALAALAVAAASASMLSAREPLRAWMAAAIATAAAVLVLPLSTATAPLYLLGAASICATLMWLADSRLVRLTERRA
jgi:hypothetical protein